VDFTPQILGEENHVNRKSYELAFSSIARGLGDCLQNHGIDAFGSGQLDAHTGGVFPFNEQGPHCDDIVSCLLRFQELCKENILPSTSFSSLIYEAIKFVKRTHRHYVLVILAPPELDKSALEETKIALAHASNYALSVVAVGIGGIDNTLKQFARDTTNFHCTSFDCAHTQLEHPNLVAFAAKALKKLPCQYKLAQRQGHLNSLRAAASQLTVLGHGGLHEHENLGSHGLRGRIQSGDSTFSLASKNSLGSMHSMSTASSMGAMHSSSMHSMGYQCHREETRVEPHKPFKLPSDGTKHRAAINRVILARERTMPASALAAIALDRNRKAEM
jgi:hypothetical protein